MSAAELRQAAETLRERAERSAAGPWEAYGNGRVGQPSKPSLIFAVAECYPLGGSHKQKQQAEYIATMHPGVALALADWLDKAGADWFAFGDEDHHRPEHEPCDYCDDDPYGPHLRSALTIARLINGGAS